MNTWNQEQLNQLPKEMLVQLYLQMSSALDTIMEQNRKITEQNERQARQIEALQENLAVLVQNRFGRKTEKVKQTDGQYSLGGQAITVKGPRATLTEHPDTIAGSNTCLYDCMKRAVLEMNVPLESAVRAASETPAKSIGVDNDYGSLAAGRYGNVILADKELNLKAVIQKGVRIV